jgi:lantibiotic modifying enzyme
MGRIEVLLYAARRLADDALRQAALDLAAQTVSRARDADGLYRWAPPGNDTFIPAFFTGAAGVGYTLLRLADASELPCVLCLE